MDPITSVSTGIILAVPWISSAGVRFEFVGNIVVRLILVLAVAAATRQGGLQGLFALLAAYSLLLERNYHLFGKFQQNSKGKMYQPIPQKQEYGPQTMPFMHSPFVGPTNHHQIETIEYEYKEEQSLPTLVRMPESFREETRNYESTDDLKDNIPYMEHAPSSEEALQFFGEKGFL
uniref:Uncharacterized protein n=1 Tax=viral metagenome TaxID=1070528 RepID=A0A6C0DPJ4_9ZZZZ